MEDYQPLGPEELAPNINTATVAGRVTKVEKLTGKTPGLSFIIAYQKHWPSGGVQEVGIKCYVSGESRLEKLAWLKPGAWALAHGELTSAGSVYAHRLEELSASGQPSDDLDEYFERMAIESQAAERRR